MASPPGGPVILDLQAVQNPDYAERGVARHAFEYARALCAERPDLVGALLLNPDLPVPSSLRPLTATGKVQIAGTGDVSAGRIYHVIGPFELEVPLERIWPSFVRGAGHHPDMRLVVTLHDLIPRVFPEHYHSDPGIRRRYLAREELVRAADRVLSVSEATRDDAVAWLGLNPRRISVIGAGISEDFRPPAAREEAFARAVAALPGLEPGFLLYVGGIDHRKNIEGLLAAYAGLPAALRAGHQLVVACRLSDRHQDRLRTAARRLGSASRLYLPGYVDDATLVSLYQSTELFVFPSLYEGYGLPVVEAMACGAPVVSSSASALAEIAPPAGQFDPTDPGSIAAAIERALTDPATRAALEAASQAPAPTWAEAVGKAASVYEELLDLPKAPRRTKLRVGFVTPLPPQGTGVAPYSHRLLEALAVHCEVDAFVDALEGGIGSLPSSPVVPGGVPVHPVEHLPRVEAARGGYDRMIYAIGNSEFHTGALAQALRRPGIVLAHDVRLPQLYAFAAHHGVLAQTFEVIFEAMYPDADEPPDPLLVAPADLNALPVAMARQLIGASEAFLTTSEFAAGLAREDAAPGEEGRIGVLALAMRTVPARPEVDRASEIVASFGVVNETKATATLIEAFAIVVAARPASRLLLVGPGSDPELEAVLVRARNLGIAGAVEVTGRVDAETWDRHLGEATLAVQLRTSTNGEFSGAVAETLAFGVPTIVATVGPMAELPDDVAVKVAPDAGPAALAAEILALLGDPARRRALTAASRAHAATRSFAEIAEDLFGWVIGSPRVIMGT